MKRRKRRGRIDIIPYRSGLVKKARELRNNATPAEKHLWTFISRKQIRGYDFDRQTPINRYIVDFFCKELKLAIELDGIYHELQSKKDLRRQNRIESFGVRVIRFEEKQVLKDIESVLTEIEYWVKKLEKLI
ncbi:MAG: DUF559 domain-containing protein [Bacteroidetes bacterium]|jgi:very-short-patch-repair endonuclease|nr:DUF559 domain-containing protein [Bacteroidota bacterium]